MITDAELGRRLAAMRAYRHMDQPEVTKAAKEKGFDRGFGASMISLTETAGHKKGTDRRSARILCEIYNIDYEVLTDPKTVIFSKPTLGIIEEMTRKLEELAGVVLDVSAQVQAVRLDEADDSDSPDQQAEPQDG